MKNSRGSLQSGSLLGFDNGQQIKSDGFQLGKNILRKLKISESLSSIDKEISLLSVGNVGNESDASSVGGSKDNKRRSSKWGQSSGNAAHERKRYSSITSVEHGRTRSADSYSDSGRKHNNNPSKNIDNPPNLTNADFIEFPLPDLKISIANTNKNNLQTQSENTQIHTNFTTFANNCLPALIEALHRQNNAINKLFWDMKINHENFQATSDKLFSNFTYLDHKLNVYNEQIKEIPALKKQNQELQKNFERLVQDQQMANLEYDDRSGREMRDVRTQLNKLNNELFLIRSGAIGSHGTTALGAAADGHYHGYLHGYNFGAAGTVVGNSGNIRNGLQRIIEERNIQNDDWTSKRSILFTFLSYCVMPLMAILFVIMYPLTYIIDFLVTLFFLYKDPRVQKKGQHGKKTGGAGQKMKGNNNNVEDNGDQDKKGTVTIDNTNSKRAVPFLKREKADNTDQQQENDESEESKNQSALQNLAIWQKTQKQKFNSSPLKVQLAFIIVLLVICSWFYIYFVLKSGTILNYFLGFCQKMIEFLQKVIAKYVDSENNKEEL